MLQSRSDVRASSLFTRGRSPLSRTAPIGRISATEQSQQLIVNELAHRAKNLLAIVQAIANQTARGSLDLNEFQPAFSKRLSALSRSIDLLLHLDERGASLPDLVQSQLEPFVDANGTRVSASGPELHLNPEATQIVGMALHELATNATKYGALSVPDGRVAITWELKPGSFGTDRFRLRWQEENGPAVAPSAQNGFGCMVLQRIVVATLGGTVKHEFDFGGVNWTLDVAAESLLMPDV